MASNHSQLVEGFLLTRQWRDLNDGIQLTLWFASAKGPIQIKINGQEAVFFCRQQDVPNLKNFLTAIDYRIGDSRLMNFRHEPVIPIYFKSHRVLRDAEKTLDKQGVTVWEADIRPPERYLMERFITAAATMARKS